MKYPVKTVVTVCQGQGAPLRCFSFNILMNVTTPDVETLYSQCSFSV